MTTTERTMSEFRVTGPGKYRTRDGRVVDIARGDDSEMPWRDSTGYWYYDNGRALFAEPSQEDIVARIDDEPAKECDLHGWDAWALPSNEGRAVSVDRAEQRQHVSDAAFAAMNAGDRFGKLEWAEHACAEAGVVVPTVAEHDELLAMLDQAQKHAIETGQKAIAANAEVMTLRAEVERLRTYQADIGPRIDRAQKVLSETGGRHLGKHVIDGLCDEIERLRKGVMPNVGRTSVDRSSRSSADAVAGDASAKTREVEMRRIPEERLARFREYLAERRLRKGSDGNVRIDEHGMVSDRVAGVAVDHVRRSDGHFVVHAAADPLDHRLGRGNGVMLRD